MVYGVILAGGVGKRMGQVEKPKQFLTIGDRPILVHTVEKFCLCKEFEKIIILCPKQWIEHTKSLIKKYIGEEDRIVVIGGGDMRNETIMNAIRFIEEEGNLDDNTIIVTHDAVRPFVTYKMIEENIKAAEEFGACDTVIPATDTIVASEDGATISDIPVRSKLYQGQTPQSFRASKFKALYEGLSDQEKEILTDAAKVFVINGEPVHLVNGATFNIKITYPYDIAVAESLIRGDVKC